MKNIFKYYTREGSKYYRYKTSIYCKMAYWDLIESTDISRLNFVFIVSTGRTGTKFLAKFFKNFNNCFAVHEPNPNFLNLGNDFIRNLINELKVKKHILAGREFYFRQVVNKYEITNFIESNNRYYSLIPVLRELFPGCKIIHVVRDGREVVRSAMTRNFYSSKDKFYRISAPDIQNDLYNSKWKSMDQFEKVCWWWYRKDIEIFKNTKDQPNSILVKFEDIFNADKNFSGLKEIIDFIGLHNLDDDKLKDLMKKENETRKFTFPHWTDWDISLIKKFNNIAGEHMKNIGYKIS